MIEHHGINIIDRSSIKDLKRVAHGWGLPNVHNVFPSLRVARVWIKRNCGCWMMSHTVRLPGKVNMVTLDGSFEV